MSDRDAIFMLLNQGVTSPIQIQRATKLPLSTINYNKRKWKEKGNPSDRPRSGRPRLYDLNDHKRITALIRHNPDLTREELVEQAIQEGSPVVSTRTMGRVLFRIERQNEFSLWRPALLQTHKEDRVAFARAHLNDNWNNTIFSSEATFQIYRNTIRIWCGSECNLYKRRPKHGTKVHAWGAFSSLGRLGFHLFTENLNEKLYIHILENHCMLPAMNQFGSNWRFQHDNDPNHHTKMTNNFLNQNFPDTLDWPPYSPDLSPFENIWLLIRRNVELRKPLTLDELKQYIEEEWEKMDASLLQNYVFSMETRLQLCIEANGEFIDC